MMLLMVAFRAPGAVARLHSQPAVRTFDSLIDPAGIADERFVYYLDTGLLPALRGRAAPHPGSELKGRQMAEFGVVVVSRDTVGFFGYGAGPSVHVVDVFALCDPLLARLPARRPWRIGHFQRSPPAGYMGTLSGEQAGLSDPRLNEYYTALRLVTRGPLWSRQRWAAIARLNLRDRTYPAAPK
jgi:arabinofuranosyltransferase